MNPKTDHITDPEYLALLRRILENPVDDAPRLIIADWLEGNGQNERAEFIRVQCELGRHIEKTKADRESGQQHNGPDRHKKDLENKLDLIWEYLHREIAPKKVMFQFCDQLKQSTDKGWSVFNEPLDERKTAVFSYPLSLVKRGFISEVRLTCSEFIGGQCPTCNGAGYDPPYEVIGCDTCKGTGRIEGVAKALFERHPITTVVLTDKDPSQGEMLFGWRNRVVGNPSDYLPEKIYRLLRSYVEDHDNWMQYESDEAALAALADACVAYGRELEGLPALETPQ